jgi:hypothetical protein
VGDQDGATSGPHAGVHADAVPPTARFRAELERTVDRLRTLGLARLEVSFEPEPTRAAAARALAQHLADLAADLEGEPQRELPVLATAACGDQLAVCGHDLLAAYAGHSGSGPAESATARDEPAPEPTDQARIQAAADLLLDLRRRL